ncbi:hypothetical protein JXL19_05310 [bacterium]|nr:hypothetical protein [bacterium]
MPVLSYIGTYLKGLAASFGLIALILLIVGAGHFQEASLSAEKVSEAIPEVIDNPHFSIKGLKKGINLSDIKCQTCHARHPKLEQGHVRNLTVDYEKACSNCHSSVPQSCSLAVNPKIYNILMIQMPDFPLPLYSGRITCASCHWIHEKEGQDRKDYRLRPEYDLFKKQAEKVDIHKTGIFCFICHEKEPRDREGPLHLKYDRDIVRICKGCHDNKRARADNHPVNIVPSKERGIRIPEDFPLADGRLTCVTCHRMNCQGEKKNPLFLRGGPYKKRLDACLVCHVKEQYTKINPHDQISGDGEIREDRCLFCHAVETDEKGEQKFGYKFKAPFSFYCVGCHPVHVERHPFGARHTGRYIESIWAGLSIDQRIKISHEQSFKMTPVSLSGQIMCASCHNPHDTRPGPKLRVSDINLSCRQCHYSHYGDETSLMRTKGNKTANDLPDAGVSPPVGDDRQPFGYLAALRFYCIGCHPNKEKRHPYGADHNGRFIKGFWKYVPAPKRVRLSQAETSQIIPLTTSGQVGCFTCHDPHDSRKGHKLRIEEKDLLCSLCHIDRSMIIEKYKKEG